MKPAEVGARSLDAEFDRAAIVEDIIPAGVLEGHSSWPDQVIGLLTRPPGDVHGVRSSNRQPSSVKD